MNLPFLVLYLCLLIPAVAYAQAHSVDPEIFEQAIRRQMDDQVMGYAFAIANADGIVAETSGGWAQAPEGRRRGSGFDTLTIVKSVLFSPPWHANHGFTCRAASIM
jgi:hypothetical protein